MLLTLLLLFTATSLTDCAECSTGASACTKCNSGKYLDGNTCKG